MSQDIKQLPAVCFLLGLPRLSITRKFYSDHGAQRDVSET